MTTNESKKETRYVVKLITPIEKFLMENVNIILNYCIVFMEQFRNEISTFIDEFLNMIEGPNGIGSFLGDMRTLITSTLAMIPFVAFIEEPINFLTPLLRSATFIFELRNKFSDFQKKAKGKFHAFKKNLDKLNRLGSTIKTGGNKEPSPSFTDRFVKNLMNDIKKKILSIIKFLMSGINVAIVSKDKIMIVVNSLVSIISPKITRIKGIIEKFTTNFIDTVPVVNTVKKGYDLLKSLNLFNVFKGSFTKKGGKRKRKIYFHQTKRSFNNTKNNRKTRRKKQE